MMRLTAARAAVTVAEAAVAVDFDNQLSALVEKRGANYVTQNRPLTRATMAQHRDRKREEQRLAAADALWLELALAVPTPPPSPPHVHLYQLPQRKRRKPQQGGA